MSESKQAAKSALIIVIFTIASKFLGYIREALIAKKFGSGAQTDAFFLALSALSLITVMVTQSINTTMIPVLSQAEAREGKEGKVYHTNNLLNVVIIISAFLAVLGWFFSPIIIRILAVGFSQEQYNLTVFLMRIGTPIILLPGILGVFRGFLQSESRFIETAATGFPSNFVYIIFLIYFSSHFGIKGLMITAVLAIVAQILFQIPAAYKIGFRYKPKLNYKDVYMKKVLILIPPVLVGVTISDLNQMVDKSMASTLVEGSISALNYASRLNNLTTSIFISAITTVIFPIFSREATKENQDGLKRALISGLNLVLLITIPIIVGMIILAEPLVKAAFQRGAFDSNATSMAVGALVFYAMGLIGSASNLLTSRVFYSLQDTKTPMIRSFISLFINVILNFILIRSMAHNGLALATSVSSILISVMSLIQLKQKIGSFGIMNTVLVGLKSLVASMLMGLVVLLLYKTISPVLSNNNWQILVALIISVIVGVVIYLIIIYLFKVKELYWIVRIAKDRIKQIRNK